MHASRRSIAVAFCAALLAGCAGASSSTELPTVRDGAASAARFVISVPHATQDATKSKRNAQYISPATQSIAVNITGPTNYSATQDLTPTSTGCSSTLASTQCVLVVALSACPSTVPNCYTATLATYDATGGTGNLLSAAQAVPFGVAAGQNNTIDLTLAGVPASTIALPRDTTTAGTATNAFTLNGQGAHRFIVESLDADGNIIVGSGAPLFTVAATGALGVTASPATTTASAPNAFALTPPTTFSTDTASISITPTYAAQSTDGCAQTGANCAPITLSVGMQYAPLLFIAHETGNNVAAYRYPYTGTPYATIVNGVSSPYGVAVDSHGNLFVAMSGGTIDEYAPPYTQAPILSISQGTNAALAIDASDDLFVASYDAKTFVELPPPYTLATATVITPSYPNSIAVNTAGTVFVSAGTGIYTYDRPYASPPSSTIATGTQVPSGLAIDANGNLWVGDQDFNFNPDLKQYAAPFTGSPITTITTGVNNPFAVATDVFGDLMASASFANTTIYQPPLGSPSTTVPGQTAALAIYNNP
jgi:sugar lactone lactonase YvrE